MIKFWKSSAKGKSGCPVRPPELLLRENINDKSILDTLQTSEINSDLSNLFEKKSQLSFTLEDILIDRKAIHLFVQFMKTIDKHILIKCWLDLEDFKMMISTVNRNLNESNTKVNISRAKSLDFHCSVTQQDCETNLWKNCEKITDSKNSAQLTISSTNLDKNNCSTEEANKICSNNNFTEKAIIFFKQYVALEAPHRLDLPDNVRKTVISNICQPEGEIKCDCFDPVEDIIYNEIKPYFEDFKSSYFYIKAQIDLLTSDSLNLNLKDILHNDTILFYFREYLEQECSRNLLEFLIAVMHFRDNLINANFVDPNQAQTDALILYEKYFSLQAISPIGFSTDVRLKIESDICREGGPLPTCFDTAYGMVFQALNHHVKMFLGSDLYFNYLSEMIRTVEQMSSTHCKSLSDCSSDISVSTHNTLLAMENQNPKNKRNHSVPDMTIDSNQLYNADSLWQRKKQDGLNIGRVNSLGRFESKFEPNPDKNSSVLKKMVNRFVPTNSSKLLEEEMAWQIAHMIVKDVTDLTMAPPDNDK